MFQVYYVFPGAFIIDFLDFEDTKLKPISLLNLWLMH